LSWFCHNINHGYTNAISMVYIRDTKSYQMKNATILFLVIFLTNYSTTFSQCTALGSLPPNTGFYPPDTAIPCITYGVFYTTNIELGNFATNDTSFGFPIDSFSIDDVTGLPPGLQWATDKVSGTYYAGEKICLQISGTTSALGAVFKPSIFVSLYANGGAFFSGVDFSDEMNGFYCFHLRVKDSNGNCLPPPNVCKKNNNNMQFTGPYMKMGAAFAYLNNGDAEIVSCPESYMLFDFEVPTSHPLHLKSENITAHGGTIAVSGHNPTLISIYYHNIDTSAKLFDFTVADSLGNSATQRFKIFTGQYDFVCNYMVSGKVYNDNNANCIFDNGDIPLSNVMVLSTKNPAGIKGAVFSTDSGFYTTYAYDSAGGNFDLNITPPGGYGGICPLGAAKVDLPFKQGGYVGYNIGLTNSSLPFRNLGVTAQRLGDWLYGYQGDRYITYYNWGNETIQPTIRMKYDSLCKFQSSSPPPVSHDSVSRELVWQGSTLQPGARDKIWVGFRMPLPMLTLPIINDTIFINPTLNDADPTNNVLINTNEVFGAYDPNDKQVKPTGTAPNGRIGLGDSVLTYTIRFQNTGTGPAVNIFLLDTLSYVLNLNTFRPLLASHPYKVSLRENILRIDFKNIMLPDSGANEKESHGFFQFSIHKKSEFGYGTMVFNSASIYFDFNEPILTNSAINTYYNFSTAIGKIEQKEDGIVVFPNPARSNVFVRSKTSDITKVLLYDMSGRLMHSETPIGKESSIDLRGLSESLYIVRIHTANGVVSRLVAISH